MQKYLPTPLLCSISKSFFILSSRACKVCFCVSILSSNSWNTPRFINIKQRQKHYEVNNKYDVSWNTDFHWGNINCMKRSKPWLRCEGNPYLKTSFVNNENHYYNFKPPQFSMLLSTIQNLMNLYIHNSLKLFMRRFLCEKHSLVRKRSRLKKIW